MERAPRPILPAPLRVRFHQPGPTLFPMSVLDRFETPGYREWDSVELRQLLVENSLRAKGDGLWVDREDEIRVLVSPFGLFVGWNDSYAKLAGPIVMRFGDVRHLPRGEEHELPEAIEEARKRRLASLIQCKHCGEMTPPGWINDRCCVSCLSEAEGIIP